MITMSIAPVKRHLYKVTLLGAAALLTACGTPPASRPKQPDSAVASSPKPTQWVEPFSFQLRTTTGSSQLDALRSAGTKFVVRSASAPEVARVVTAELAAAGFQIARDSEPATVLNLAAKITIAPPDNYDPKNVVDFLPLTEQALQTGRSLSADATGSTGLRQLVFPLGGYRTSFGSTGASQASVYFVLANLLGATGAREKFNALFGADATGTVCFRISGVNDLICDRKKGPLAEVALTLSYTDRGTAQSIATNHSLIQLAANPMQALAYAVSDLRDAALGRATPVCNYKTSKVREPGCAVPPAATGS